MKKSLIPVELVDHIMQGNCALFVGPDSLIENHDFTVLYFSPNLSPNEMQPNNYILVVG